jgi:diacylglycerol O-acyltransferase / wax synthase
MSQRLTALDASFLYMDSRSTPMHVGTVSVFSRPAEGFDHERLVRLIRMRLAYVPRYRQRLKSVPFGLARPVWVDDTEFDVTFHVRRSALPKPGSREQLEELVGRIMSRPLDPTRPLWEMTLVEGLADESFAIVTKTHEALVDGFAALDLATAILDSTADADPGLIDAWAAQREPTGAELLTEALTQLATSPRLAMEAAQSAVTTIASSVGGVLSTVKDAAVAAVSVPRATGHLPLNVEIGEQRRFMTVDLALDDLKAIRKLHGGSVNDAVLAVITGALREWLISRGVPVLSGMTLRAVVPISTKHGDEAAQVSAFLVDLPVGEPKAVMRIEQITYQTSRIKESGNLLGADAILGLAGFAPPTLHALGARLASRLSSRMYNISITNVPGPQQARYAAGAPMTASYPVMPLAPQQALSLGLTSYQGRVFVGLNADRDAIRDLPVIATGLHAAVNELRDGVSRHLRPIRDEAHRRAQQTGSG